MGLHETAVRRQAAVVVVVEVVAAAGEHACVVVDVVAQHLVAVEDTADVKAPARSFFEIYVAVYAAGESAMCIFVPDSPQVPI